MNDMTRYEDTRRWEQRPEPVKTVPITPEQLIYLAGGPPPGSMESREAFKYVACKAPRVQIFGKVNP